MDRVDLTEIKTGSEHVFSGVIMNVYRDTVELPDGSSSTREFIKHIGAVAVVPLTDDGKIIMEHQFRYPLGRTILEIPAGKLDEYNENRLLAAKRELREETGITADNWTDLGPINVAPAYSDELLTLFLARGLHFGNQELDSDEFLFTEAIPVWDLVEMVENGKIADSKTQIAILKTARILGI